MRIVLQRATLAAVIAFATTASAFAQSAADLFITKTAPATANPGDNVTFTVTIGNVGPDPSTGVNMTDTLPPESTFVSEMQTGGPTTFVCTTPNVGDFGGSVSCVATADIAEAETETFQIVVNVPVAAAGATLINSASVSAETPDDDDENNSSIAATTISGGTLADVGIMKSGPASALPSSNVTFTITVTDFGPNDASTVTFDDVLGSGLTFVSLNQTGGPAFS
ncbi:MAG TPA: DUF11 domain-containing protein, partial [Vicinamibacterales bacterium]|nr:DUF11 domain-containing protein [Vicinamibacterales bacterium]